MTTNRYPIRFHLVDGSAGGSEQQLSVAAAEGGSSGGGANATAAGGGRSPGWPLPPAMQAGCAICPRGWAAGGGEWGKSPAGEVVAAGWTVYRRYEGSSST